jgi:hypothetical protein
MRYFLGIITALFLLAGVGTIAQTGDKTPTSKTKDVSPAARTETARIYPIAPGVWYPGDGALPEKPVRYYRARCWPGCHRGSSHGKYPDIPLKMKPIFPTSTIDLCPEAPMKRE